MTSGWRTSNRLSDTLACDRSKLEQVHTSSMSNSTQLCRVQLTRRWEVDRGDLLCFQTPVRLDWWNRKYSGHSSNLAARCTAQQNGEPQNKPFESSLGCTGNAMERFESASLDPPERCWSSQQIACCRHPGRYLLLNYRLSVQTREQLLYLKLGWKIEAEDLRHHQTADEQRDYQHARRSGPDSYTVLERIAFVEAPLSVSKLALLVWKFRSLVMERR